MTLLLLYGRCMTAVRDVTSDEEREVLTKFSQIIKKYTGMMWNHPLPQRMYFDHPLMHHSEGFLATYTRSRDSIIQMSLIFPYFQMCPIFPVLVGFELLDCRLCNALCFVKNDFPCVRDCKSTTTVTVSATVVRCTEMEVLYRT